MGLMKSASLSFSSAKEILHHNCNCGNTDSIAMESTAKYWCSHFRNKDVSKRELFIGVSVAALRPVVVYYCLSSMEHCRTVSRML